MAAGDYSDFKIYEPEFYGGMFEAVDQVTQAFNGASAGAIRLVARQLKGHYEKESFLQEISSLITRRDIASVAAATDLPMTQGEFISVKVNRKIGPVAQTLDAWRKLGTNASEMSFQLGRAVGERKIKDYINTALLCVETGIQSVSALNVTSHSAATLTHGFLVEAMAKMGDNAGTLVAWVMHSKPYFDLVGQAITDKVFEVAGATIMSGNVATLGKPTIVIDSPSLTDANGSATDTYNVLGLVPGAVTVTESEQQEIFSDIVTGLENIVMRVQGEYAFNVGVKGMKWDVTSGSLNPTDAALGTTTNWDQAATSAKACAGVRLVVK